MMLRYWLLALLLILGGCAPVPAAPGVTPTSAASPPPLATTVILGDRQTLELPAVVAEQARRRAALAAPPYILLREGLDERLAAAQTAVANAAGLQLYTRTSDGQRLLTEVMSVASPRPGDLPPGVVAQCSPDVCLRVVLYIYPTNMTLSAIVNRRLDLIDLQALEGAQPEVPQELAELATQIAINDPQVAAAFDGLSPDEAMAAMSATKTALEGSSCERSRHLCVAPVFTWGTTALWTIVDLTELTLVAATTWTEQGQSARRHAVSEAILQDAALAPLCETPGRFERDGWSADYLLTSSDGLELRNITYQGQLLLASVKVVDWHVGYVGTDDERVGFSDAVGCPVFSAAAVIPYSLPELREGPGAGFTLAITFRSPAWPQPCNYQYTFTASFGPDGTLDLSAGNEGRGCGVNGTYHPVWRIEPAAPAPLNLWDGAALSKLDNENLAEWPAGGSQAFQLEGSVPLRITPVWGDAELAYVYWTQARPEEGQGDLASIGSCCALDQRQGPEQFVNDEPLEDRPVIWYVPRLTNAQRERCWADMELEDGLLRPVIWPCAAGLRVSQGGHNGTP